MRRAYVISEAPKCKAIGCNRRTTRANGYCFQHEDMAPLDRIVDKVLRYKVPARTAKAKKRQRKRRKVQSGLCI